VVRVILKLRGRLYFKSCKVRIEIFREEEEERVLVVEVVEQKFVLCRVWRGRYYFKGVVVVMINHHHLHLPLLLLPLLLLLLLLKQSINQ